jgi:hypothetical protein
VQKFPLNKKVQGDQNINIYNEIFSTAHSAASCFKTIYGDKIKVLEQSPLQKY